MYKLKAAFCVVFYLFVFFFFLKLTWLSVVDFYYYFFPSFLGFLKDVSKHKGGGKIFLIFLLFFHEQRVGIDHLLVVVSAVISLWDVSNV